MRRARMATATKERLLAALRANVDSKTSVAVEAVRTALRPDATSEDEANAPLSDTEKQVQELAMRILMEELLAKSKQPGMSIEAAGVSRHLDLAIALAAAEASDPNTPFALLEDLFDANVISAAESLFALVEARAAALAPFLTADAKYQRCKLTLIRSCNELLRRLSKSKNTNFRGRVLMFMAYTFPLGERSGVNLKGATAPSSVEIEAEGDGDEEDMQVDAGAAGAGAESGNGPAQGVVNYGFYATFWGLQKAFADPAKSVVKDAWPGLVERLQTVLEVFGSFSGSDDVAEEGSEDGEGEDGAADQAAQAAAEAEAEEVLEEVYFAKFLTSSKLMTLQLRDGYFRRHVLVQVLIFLQTVATERKGVPTLSASQRQQVDTLHSRCFELLRAIPPGGARFASAVSTMLEREEHWIRWKANGCVPFDKAAAAAREDGGAGGSSIQRKRKLSSAAGGAKKMQLGNSALTRLWNMGGNSLEDIAQKQSDMVPSLEGYLAPVAEQMDPEAGIEEEYKVKNDKAFQWKALRLMAKKDVGLLSKVSMPNGGLETAVKFFFDQQEGAAKGDGAAGAVETKTETPEAAAEGSAKAE